MTSRVHAVRGDLSASEVQTTAAAPWVSACQTGWVVVIRPVARSDPRLGAWCSLLAEGLRAESGGGLSGDIIAARVNAEPPDAGVRRWAACAGSAVIGVAQSGLDRGAAFVRLFVTPTHRRRGVGTALLSAVRDAHRGIVLKGIAVAGQAGERFAATFGARVVMRLAVLEQRLSDLDPGPAKLPAGCQVVCWRDEAPEELIDSYAAAYCHLADAPGSHHQIVDPHWDRDRVRGWEREVRLGGQELWVCAAVFDDTVAAFTEIEVGPQPAASQHATVVLPRYRGRGLGTAVKVALVRRLRASRPDIATVTATVNEANSPMVALNTRIGYRVVRTRLMVELG